jgi:hypothetical protein
MCADVLSGGGALFQLTVVVASVVVLKILD